MFRRLLIVVILIGISGSAAWGAIRGDVKILEASDTIKYRINDLAKNYLLYYRFPHKSVELKKALEQDLVALKKSLQVIAVTTRDEKTKNLLAFFVYQEARIGEILERKPDRKSLEEILEMSESFIEGADSIARHHMYRYSFEEEMFIRIRSMIQRLEEILKYYIATPLFSDDPNVKKKMDRAVKRFEVDLQQIIRYEYKEKEIRALREESRGLWHDIRPYLLDSSRPSYPMLMTVAAGRIEAVLDRLAIYHSKNQ